jgi:hypothetical protein
MHQHDNNEPIELSDDELETVAAGMLTLRSTSGVADRGISSLTSGLVNKLAVLLNVGGQV